MHTSCLNTTYIAPMQSPNKLNSSVVILIFRLFVYFIVFIGYSRIGLQQFCSWGNVPCLYHNTVLNIVIYPFLAKPSELPVLGVSREGWVRLRVKWCGEPSTGRNSQVNEAVVRTSFSQIDARFQNETNQLPCESKAKNNRLSLI